MPRSKRVRKDQIREDAALAGLSLQGYALFNDLIIIEDQPDYDPYRVEEREPAN